MTVFPLPSPSTFLLPPPLSLSFRKHDKRSWWWGIQVLEWCCRETDEDSSSENDRRETNNQWIQDILYCDGFIFFIVDFPSHIIILLFISFANILIQSFQKAKHWSWIIILFALLLHSNYRREMLYRMKIWDAMW